MKVVSLFSGVGGFDLGFERAGFEVVACCEFERNCRKLLSEKFPNARLIPDVRAILSVYRRIRRGLPVINAHVWKEIFELVRSADVFCGGFPCQDVSVAGNRAGLAGERSGLWHVFRRLLAVFLPAWVVIENVPGLLSSNKGRDFSAIVSGLADIGFGWAYRILDAQYFGLAQRRERVFVVGSLGAMRCAEILFERESVCGDSAPSREARKNVAGTLGGSSQSGGFRTTDLDNTLVAGAVSAKWAKGTGGPAGDECYNLVAPILEAGARTGKSTDDARCGSGIGDDGDPMFTLQSGKQHAVAYRTTGNDGVYEQGDKVARLNGASDPTQNVVAFDTTQITNAENRSTPRPGDPCHPLTSGGHPPAITGSTVRRLTPRECERLQGFPDDWTAGFADSVRYRMLGNAVAVPCAEWIAKRLFQTHNPSV